MGREEAAITALLVSMKSGLRDRNNSVSWSHDSACGHIVSMKSGLGDRNNAWAYALQVTDLGSQ